MITIGELNICMDDIRFITIIESGKSFKDALLHYYSNNEVKYNYINKNINSKSIIKVLAKDEDDLDYFITFFESIKITKKQKIKLRTYNMRINKIYEILSVCDDNDFYDRLIINLDHNTEFIPYKKFKRFANVLNGIISLIPNNLSQIEIITYVYDIVKSRPYKLVPGDDKSYKSRLLSDVMVKEYISCVGFAKMFNAILAEYGINSTEYMYIPKDGLGHDISLVNINDSKYNIKGLYFFDPCMDCYLEKDDEKNMCKYKGFFRTISDYLNIPVDKDSFACLLHMPDNEIDNLLAFYKEAKETGYSNTRDYRLLRTIVGLCSLVQDLNLDFPIFSNGTIVDDEISIYTCIKEFKKIFGSDIDPDCFVKILFNTNHDKKQIINSLYSKYGADTTYSYIKKKTT